MNYVEIEAPTWAKTNPIRYLNMQLAHAQLRKKRTRNKKNKRKWNVRIKEINSAIKQEQLTEFLLKE